MGSLFSHISLVRWRLIFFKFQPFFLQSSPYKKILREIFVVYAQKLNGGVLLFEVNAGSSGAVNANERQAGKSSHFLVKVWQSTSEKNPSHSTLESGTTMNKEELSTSDVYHDFHKIRSRRTPMIGLKVLNLLLACAEMISFLFIVPLE